jgi:hypothetical protein
MSDSPTPFIVGPVNYVNGLPHQRRWVQTYTRDGTAVSVSKNEFAATPKCYNADGSYMSRPPDECPPESLPQNGKPSGSKYAKCILIQPESLPPTLVAPKTIEKFTMDQDLQINYIRSLTGILALIAVWSLLRNH